jgi:hypothetical protein
LTDITKSAGGSGYNAGGFGQDNLNTGELHQLEFTVNNVASSAYVIGIGNGNAGEGLTDMDYAWEVINGVAQPRELTTTPHSTTAVVAGDKLRVQISANNEVAYFINDVKEYDSTVPATLFPYNVDLSMFNQGDVITNVKLDDVNAIFKEDASKVNVTFNYDDRYVADVTTRMPNFDFHDFDHLTEDFGHVRDNFQDLDFDAWDFDHDAYPWIVNNFPYQDFDEDYDIYYTEGQLGLNYYETDFDENNFQIYAQRGPDFDTQNADFFEFVLDMLTQQEQSMTTLADMRVGTGFNDIFYTADMVILLNGVREIVCDLLLRNVRTISFDADLLVRQLVTDSIDADLRVVIQGQMLPTADMKVAKLDNVLAHTSDLIVKLLGASLSPTADLILRGELDLLFSADMITQATFLDTLSADLRVIVAGLVPITADMLLLGRDFNFPITLDLVVVSDIISPATEDQGFIRRGTEDFGYIQISSERKGYIKRGTQDAGFIT